MLHILNELVFVSLECFLVFMSSEFQKQTLTELQTDVKFEIVILSLLLPNKGSSSFDISLISKSHTILVLFQKTLFSHLFLYVRKYM